MANSTSILGPFDDLPTIDKVVVSAMISQEIRDMLFKEFLPRRGAVDKLIARSLAALAAYVLQYPALMELEVSERERFMNDLLNSITVHLQNTKANSLL